MGSDFIKVSLPGREKIAICDERSIGLRQDINGILLLDTVLQPGVYQLETLIKLELPLPEV